jgi:hypothetical protein
MGFIDHFASLKDVAHKRVTHGESLRYLLWCADQQVKRHRRIDPASDLDGLFVSSALEGHYDEKIHIRIPRWFAIGVRPKQYDFPRLKLAHNLFGELLDLFITSGSNRFHCEPDYTPGAEGFAHRLPLNHSRHDLTDAALQLAIVGDG